MIMSHELFYFATLLATFDQAADSCTWYAHANYKLLKQ